MIERGGKNICIEYCPLKWEKLDKRSYALIKSPKYNDNIREKS